MPELPEVESARRRAEAALGGRRIVEVATVPDRLVFSGTTPTQFAAALRGRRVERVHRKGKHLWMQLDEPPFRSSTSGWLALGGLCPGRS